MLWCPWYNALKGRFQILSQATGKRRVDTMIQMSYLSLKILEHELPLKKNLYKTLITNTYYRKHNTMICNLYVFSFHKIYWNLNLYPVWSSCLELKSATHWSFDCFVHSTLYTGTPSLSWVIYYVLHICKGMILVLKYSCTNL